MKLNIDRLVIDHAGGHIDPERLRDALQRELAAGLGRDGSVRPPAGGGSLAGESRGRPESILARDLAIRIREAMKR